MENLDSEIAGEETWNLFLLALASWGSHLFVTAGLFASVTPGLALALTLVTGVLLWGIHAIASLLTSRAHSTRLLARRDFLAASFIRLWPPYRDFDGFLGESMQHADRVIRSLEKKAPVSAIAEPWPFGFVGVFSLWIASLVAAAILGLLARPHVSSALSMLEMAAAWLGG